MSLYINYDLRIKDGYLTKIFYGHLDIVGNSSDAKLLFKTQRDILMLP